MKQLPLNLVTWIPLTFVLFCTNALASTALFGVRPAISYTHEISDYVSFNIFGATTIQFFNLSQDQTPFHAGDRQLYLQPGLTMKVSPLVNISMGYAYQNNRPFQPGSAYENRTWEQVILLQKVQRSNITHRFRFEQRFIENLASHTFPLSTRLRYQLAFKTPLTGRRLDFNEYYLNFYNEFYFNTSGANTPFLSGDWLYVGVGKNTSLGKFEIGPLYEFSQNFDSIGHLILIQATWIP